MKLYTLFVVFMVMILFVGLSSAECANWRLYKNQADIEQNGIKAGVTKTNKQTYVGRATIDGIYVSGRIEDGKFYAKQRVLLRNFQYLVADELNTYDWVESTDQECIPNSVFVGEHPIGRDNDEQALVGFIEDKMLYVVTQGSAVMSVDSYDVLTCRPKPCKSGKELETCRTNLAIAKFNLTQNEAVVNSADKEIENLDDLNKNLKNNLGECEGNLQKCNLSIEAQIQHRLQAIQNQLNEAKAKISNLEAENKAAKVENLQLQNQVNNCKPDCPTTSRPYPPSTTYRTTTRSSNDFSSGDDFKACLNYIRDEESRQYYKVVQIRNAANDFILGTSNPTPKPFEK